MRILQDLLNLRKALGGKFPLILILARKNKMLAYPETLPLTCVQNVIAILKNRNIDENKSEFAHCVWNVQGYLQKVLFGDPALHGACPEDCDDCEVTTEEWEDLASQMRMYQDDTFGSAEATALPWAAIIQMILPLILEFLKKKKT